MSHISLIVMMLGLFSLPNHTGAEVVADETCQYDCGLTVDLQKEEMAMLDTSLLQTSFSLGSASHALPVGQVVVDLASGNPPASELPMEMMREAADARLGPDENVDLLQYNGDSTETLPTAIGTLFNVDPSEIVITNGGVTKTVELFCLEAIASARGEGVILVEEASFWFMGGLSSVCSGGNVKTVPVQLTSGGYLDVDDLERVLQNLNASAPPLMLYTIPEFQNPMGGNLPTGDRHKLLDLADEFSFTVVADSVYRYLNYSEPVPASLVDLNKDRAKPARVFEVYSFAKIISGPGLALGWVRAHPALALEFRSSPVSVFTTFIQGILARAINDGLIATQLAKVKEDMRHRGEVFQTALADNGFQAGPLRGGYFYWLCTNTDAETLLAQATLSGVTFLPASGSLIDSGNTRLKKCFRASMSNGDDASQRLGAERLAQVLGTENITLAQGVYPSDVNLDLHEDHVRVAQLQVGSTMRHKGNSC